MTVYQVKTEETKKDGFTFIQTLLFSTLHKASEHLMSDINYAKIRLKDLSSKKSGTHFFGTGYNRNEEFTCVYITSEKVY